jgi:hypothetical protein
MPISRLFFVFYFIVIPQSFFPRPIPLPRCLGAVGIAAGSTPTLVIGGLAFGLVYLGLSLANRKPVEATGTGTSSGANLNAAIDPNAPSSGPVGVDGASTNTVADALIEAYNAAATAATAAATAATAAATAATNAAAAATAAAAAATAATNAAAAATAATNAAAVATAANAAATAATAAATAATNAAAAATAAATVAAAATAIAAPATINVAATENIDTESSTINSDNNTPVNEDV